MGVLNHLISLGFDVNSFRSYDKTCLNIAVDNKHYNAARLLDKHGAEGVDEEPLIWLLASQPNVPLDLFDLLATPQNLNPEFYSPLHMAVACGHTAVALHLIKLGASVNNQDDTENLPIECYVDYVTEANKFNNELFMSLLPARNQGVNILATICKILGNKQQDGNNSCLMEMIRHSVQRLHFDKPLEVEMGYEHEYYGGALKINEVEVLPFCDSSALDVMYLCSLILVELPLDLILAPCEINFQLQMTKQDTYYARAVNDMWRKYHLQSCVKSLQKLCILSDRSSMNSLDDESFLSLPVPPYIRKLLAYQNVSEEIFKEWQQGPRVP